VITPFDPESCRRDIYLLYQKALAAVCPTRLVINALDKLSKKSPALYKAYFGRSGTPLLIIGAGKAVLAMAHGTLAHVRDQTVRGVLIGPTASSPSVFAPLIYFHGTHPLPSEAGCEGVRTIVKLIRQSSLESNILVLVSGGASSLLTLPIEPFSLDDLRIIYHKLILSGATITEINTLRKHLSLLAGGGLARIAYPRRVLGLVISDIVGDPVQMIGSGPTAANTSTWQEAMKILEHYDLINILPQKLRDKLGQMTTARMKPISGTEKALFERVTNLIIGDNGLARKSIVSNAPVLGYTPVELPNLQMGDVQFLAQEHIRLIREFFQTRPKHCRPHLFVSGGEATIRVTGTGLGGRNQHFILETVPLIAELPFVTASIGTDGIDGNSNAAGAVADGQTLSRAQKLGLDYHIFLRNFDSYNFFKALGDLIITGETGTNVMDLRMMIATTPAE